ncbi:RNA 2'-phosphotransferase, Tpt1 [Xylariomycetidae sp. FL0641]|nr:RNA 2'-phosphotransferase, Tpt1 [Xylariomycetidae sp. FL0641]
MDKRQVGSKGPNRKVQISKALSTLLRHQAANAGITLDAEGYAPLDQVMQWPRLASLKPTLAEIQSEVSTNEKQRFSLKPNPSSSSSSSSPAESDDPAHWLIRANQGHSIASVAAAGLHTPLTLEAGNVPPVVVHGTYYAFWPAILAAGGLRPMGRTHVHFGTGVPADDADDAAPGGRPVVSGMRADAELLVFVDVARSLRDGHRWWVSANGVVLADGGEAGVVPLAHFSEVRGRTQGVGVLWRNGEKVADLPEGVVARVPRGKEKDDNLLSEIFNK